MTIVRCSKCNRLIHRDMFCFFCGDDSEGEHISDAQVHNNAADSFAVAEEMLTLGLFEKAESALAEVMKWSANSSEAHWLRLLLRAKCRNDTELFYSGLDIEGTPDYETALRYASDYEKQVYTSVGKACSSLKKTLSEMIKSRNIRTIEELNLHDTLNGLQRFIEEKRAKLLSAWQELRKCEQELKLLESEGTIFIHECRNNMQSICDDASELRENLENTSEMGRKEYLLYKTKIEGLRKTANAAKDEYYRLSSQHPSLGNFSELCKKREELKSIIAALLDEVKNYEKSIERVISELNSKKKEANMLMEIAEAGNYEQVKAALGQRNFDRAVKYALSL